MKSITLNVNDTDYSLQIEENWTLLHVLREVLGLTGTKYGCGTGDCGSCKVLINGEPKNSCTILVRKVLKDKIVTIEGISRGRELHPVQKAFIDSGAIQCGYCTPGMVITSVALLEKNRDPSKDEIVKALDNNICRCTGYKKIIEAIQLAGRRIRGEE